MVHLRNSFTILVPERQRQLDSFSPSFSRVYFKWAITGVFFFIFVFSLQLPVNL